MLQQNENARQPILLQHSLQLLKKQSQLIMLHQMEQQLLVQIIPLAQEQSHLHPMSQHRISLLLCLQIQPMKMDETVTVTLSNPSEVTINDAIGLLTITDDDNEPNISIADMTTPNETAVGRSITVSLDAASEKTITVDYTTADGTATATNDYVSTTGTLTFNAW